MSSAEVLENSSAPGFITCVELGEDRLLDVHLLEHRLDHHVGVGDVVVAGDRVDAGEAAVHLVLRPGCRA